MGFDPWLYAALGAGLFAAWATRWRSPWVFRLLLGAVGLLLFLLGDTLAAEPWATLVIGVPLSAALAGLVLLFTGLFARLLPHAPGQPGSTPPSTRWFAPAFLAAFLAGFGPGRWVPLLGGASLSYALYGLLFLVGLDFQWIRPALRTVIAPLTAATLGALLAALVFAALGGADLRTSLGATLAFGWYSLDGPLLATQLGATAGLLGFLSNFLRESVTMVAAPALGPGGGPELIVSMAGATAMDTNLASVTRFGDPHAGAEALASGLVLTIAASLALPVLLSLPLP